MIAVSYSSCKAVTHFLKIYHFMFHFMSSLVSWDFSIPQILKTHVWLLTWNITFLVKYFIKKSIECCLHLSSTGYSKLPTFDTPSLCEKKIILEHETLEPK